MRVWPVRTTGGTGGGLDGNGSRTHSLLPCGGAAAGEEPCGQRHGGCQDLLITRGRGRDGGEEGVCVGRQRAPELVQAVVGHTLPQRGREGREQGMGLLQWMEELLKHMPFLS